MNREDMKQILSNIYALQVKGMQMQCPCCGNEMRADINENSLSRYHEVYICSRCGMNEALSGATPLEDWVAIKSIENAHKTIEKALCNDGDEFGPGTVIVKNKAGGIVGALLVKNADRHLTACAEDIEANWAAMRESYLERAKEDESFSFDEDGEHLAYVEEQLKLCVSDDAKHTPYEVINLDNVCVLEVL